MYVRCDKLGEWRNVCLIWHVRNKNQLMFDVTNKEEIEMFVWQKKVRKEMA